MANKIQYSNASEIFTLRKQGVNVPLDVLAAARKTMQGTGSANDAALIRNYIGIQHSGRAKIKQAVGQVRNLRGAVSDVERAAEMYSTQVAQGGNPLPAGVRLVQTLGDKFQDFLRTKLVKNVAVDVGKMIGSDARISKAFLLSLRRAASFAGGVATAVGIGADIGGSIGLGLFDAGVKRNKTQGFSSDTARAMGANVADFAVQAAMIRSRVQDSKGIYATVRDALGFDESTTEEEEKQIKVRAQNQARARALAPNLINNPAALLAEEARKKGKTVEELTDREVNQVLDRQNRHMLSGEENVPDWSSPPERLKTWVAKQPAAYKASLAMMTYAQIQKEFQRVYEEVIVPEMLQGKEIENAKKKENAENTREALFNSPEKKAAFRELIQVSQANYQAEYARHKVVEYD